MTPERFLFLGAGLMLFFMFGLGCGYLLWAPAAIDRRRLKRANRMAENLGRRPVRPYPDRLTPDDAGYIASIDN